MGDDSRLKEAQQCIAKAEKHIKTSIWQLKTKPEYDLASYEYDRAAICYKNCGDLARSMEMYLKSAECHRQNNNKFHEAKSNEQAAMIAKEAGQLDKATELFEFSAQRYLDANSWDTASQVIDKAGKILEQADITKAIKLYQRGIQIVTEADRPKTVISLSHRLLGLHLRQKEWSEAINVSISLINTYKDIGECGKIGQIALGMVIVGLLKDDSIASRQYLSYFTEDQGASNEMQVAQALIVRYEKGDDEQLQQALQGGVVRSMDNSYLRIVKDLKAPSGGGFGHPQEQDHDEEDDLR